MHTYAEQLKKCSEEIKEMIMHFQKRFRHIFGGAICGESLFGYGLYLSGDKLLKFGEFTGRAIRLPHAMSRCE